MSYFKAKNAPQSISAGAPPQLDPAGGAYSAPPDPLAGFGGLLLRGGKRRGEKGRGGEGRKGKHEHTPA